MGGLLYTGASPDRETNLLNVSAGYDLLMASSRGPRILRGPLGHLTLPYLPSFRCSWEDWYLNLAIRALSCSAVWLSDWASWATASLALAVSSLE